MRNFYLFCFIMCLFAGSLNLHAQKEDNPLNYPYYIMGDQLVTGKSSSTLSNIQYKGFSSNISSGGITSGRRNENEKLVYIFNDITTNPKLSLDNKVLLYWRYEDGIWMPDSESGNATANKRMDKDACFLLVLDCSGSLGTDFEQVKISAKCFIDEMYNSSNQGNIRIGIISFSTMENTKVFDITPLTATNKIEMHKFINGRTNRQPATSMYYALNKGLDELVKYTNTNNFKDFEGVHIITFTDGLDNTSQIEDEKLYTANEIHNFVENKIHNLKINNTLFDSWMIGVQGNDVPTQQLNRMKTKLQSLASTPSQFLWANNISELTQIFSQIANTLTNKWTNLYCTSALNHNGPVCWTYGTPRYEAPKPVVTKNKHMLLGLNAGLGYGVADGDADAKITFGLDIAYPLTNKFGLGGYCSIGYLYDADFAVGALATIGDHNERKIKFMCGLGTNINYWGGLSADFRFGLMFRNGLYLMTDVSAGGSNAATINIGYNFGKLFKVK